MQNATLPSSASHVKPQDTYGGTGLLGAVGGLLDLSLFDSSPALNGKTLAHFYIGVDEVDAIANGTSYPVVQFGSPYMVDLLQYQNGNALSMAQTQMPAQTYSQVRLILNVASTQITFSDGSSLPVSFKTTSSQSSAHAATQTTTSTDPTIAGAVDVTINSPFTVGSGATDLLAADFNVLESLTANSSTIFIRPSMFAADHAGHVTGTVVNANGLPVANAVVIASSSSGTVANTASTDSNGNFDLHAVQAGTYQLTIYNSYTTAAGQNMSASGQSSTAASVNGPTITVTDGGTQSIGTIND